MRCADHIYLVSWTCGAKFAMMSYIYSRLWPSVVQAEEAKHGLMLRETDTPVTKAPVKWARRHQESR